MVEPSSSRNAEQIELSDAVGLLPEDALNTAPETRAWYRYQDEVAALLVLRHLDADDLEGVLIEHSADLALIPREGRAELVSIKHREDLQHAASSWSWNALRDRVLPHLFRLWDEAGRDCRVAFCTNNGFSGQANALAKVCGTDAEVPASIAKTLAAQFETDSQTVADFVGALTLDGQLPRRKDITDVAVRTMERLLRRHRSGSGVDAERCYRRLYEVVASVSTDVPEAELALSPNATIAEAVRQRDMVRRHRKYLDASHLLNAILHVHDLAAAQWYSSQDWPQWHADPRFVGREKHIALIDAALKPGCALEVPPVVIHGVTGCGKSSLATQYAATRSSLFRTVFINGSTRESVAQGLAKLSGQETNSDDIGVAELQGPVTVELPGSCATLIIIDGVVDPQAVLGLIPRQSLCRVLITSTAHHIDPGFTSTELDVWEQDESIEFIAGALPDADDKDRSALAQRLHGHPLAIAQAVSYCVATGNTIPHLLDVYSQQPLAVLQREGTPGHAVSTVKMTQILLDVARERHPHAEDLAMILAYLGREPVEVALFNFNDEFFDEEIQFRVQGLSAKLARRVFRRAFERADRLKANMQRTAFISRVLRKVDERDTAIEVLLSLSLVSKQGNALVIHPLVALILRELNADPGHHLALGFAMFVPGAFSVGFDRQAHFVRHINHIHALTSHALDRKLEHPVIVAGCCAVARDMHYLPAPIDPDTPYWDASRIAAAGRAMAQHYVRARILPVEALITINAAEAQLHHRSGNDQIAVERLIENTHLGRKHRRVEMGARSLTDLAIVVSHAGRMDLAADILNKLPSDTECATLDPRMQIAYARARTRIFRLQGRLQEAEEYNIHAQQVFLDAADGEVSDVDMMHVFEDGAQIARDIGDVESIHHYESAALQILKRRWGHRTDRLLVERLCSAADGAIAANEFAAAEAAISEAEQIVQEGFADDVTMNAQLQAVKGRNFLHQGDFEAARTHLLAANEGLRRAPAPNAPAGLPAVLIHLAHTETWRGDYAAALDLAQEAYDIDHAYYGPNHAETLQDRGILLDKKLDEAGRCGAMGAQKLVSAIAEERDNMAVTVALNPDGSWFAGGIIASTDNVSSHEEAVAWADKILADECRNNPLWTHGADSVSYVTVDNPMAMILLRNLGPGWMLIENWAHQGINKFMQASSATHRTISSTE